MFIIIKMIVRISQRIPYYNLDPLFKIDTEVLFWVSKIPGFNSNQQNNNIASF